MSSLLIQNAWAVVTCDDEDHLLKCANILIRDGVIAYMGPESPPADETLDASRSIVYPGLINTHHHLYQTFSRNLPQVQNLELFDWLTALYEIWKNLDSEAVYHSSVVGMGELLKSGCTTCFDHHYVFPRTAACRRTAWSRPWTKFCGIAGRRWRNTTMLPSTPCEWWPWLPALPSASQRSCCGSPRCWLGIWESGSTPISARPRTRNTMFWKSTANAPWPIWRTWGGLARTCGTPTGFTSTTRN